MRDHCQFLFISAFAFGCAACVAVVTALRSRRRGASEADARTAGATEEETSESSAG